MLFDINWNVFISGEALAECVTNEVMLNEFQFILFPVSLDSRNDLNCKYNSCDDITVIS